jgi:hypothetical protein
MSDLTSFLWVHQNSESIVKPRAKNSSEAIKIQKHVQRRAQQKKRDRLLGISAMRDSKSASQGDTPSEASANKMTTSKPPGRCAANSTGHDMTCPQVPERDLRVPPSPISKCNSCTPPLPLDPQEPDISGAEEELQRTRDVAQQLQFLAAQVEAGNIFDDQLGSLGAESAQALDDIPAVKMTRRFQFVEQLQTAIYDSCETTLVSSPLFSNPLLISDSEEVASLKLCESPTTSPSAFQFKG